MLTNLFNFIFKNNDLPRWIVKLNQISLAGIFAWPFVLFVSIFLFDHPQNLGQTYLIFFLINCYPVVLMMLTFFSYKVFHLNRLISALFPLLAICAYVFVIFMIAING